MERAQIALSYIAAFAVGMTAVVAAYVVIQALITLLGVLLSGVLAIGVGYYAATKIAGKTTDLIGNVRARFAR